MAFYLDIFLLFILLIFIFFVSKYIVNELYYFLRLFIKDEKIIFSIISVIFLPGTIIHELSHYLMAILLALNVREITIFPRFEKNRIELGGVTYIKKDFIRGILVGVAPFFLALCIFLLIGSFKIFPQENLWLNILMIYFIFTVSSTMFSSEKDLEEIIFIIPLMIIIVGIVYILNIKINTIFQGNFLNNLISFAKTINYYLLLSLAINFVLFLLLKSVKLILKK